jgi:hypothetical protein
MSSKAPGEIAAEEAPGTPPARSPIVEAASRAVIAVFDQLATEAPELIRPQPPPHSAAPMFTREMIEQLQAQLRRSLGIGPEGPK